MIMFYFYVYIIKFHGPLLFPSIMKLGYVFDSNRFINPYRPSFAITLAMDILKQYAYRTYIPIHYGE